MSKTGSYPITASGAEVPNTDNYEAEIVYVDGTLTVRTRSSESTSTADKTDKTENEDVPCDGGRDCPSRAFSDLDSSKWYHEAVDYAIENGLMSGFTDGTFKPNGTLTRAMLAQILYNLEDQPAVSGSSGFTDVKDTDWYAKAVTWAARNGLVTGYTNGTFGPEDPITREQLAVILWRYAGSPRATGTLRFTDAEVSEYAVEAMLWATQNGVINGSNGRLNPKGNATRAEVAQMLMNFIRKTEE